MLLDTKTAVPTAERDDFAWLGSGNTWLPEMEAITEAELVTRTKWGTFSPEYTGYAQVYLTPEDREDRKITSIHFFLFHDGTGVAYRTNYWAAYYQMEGRDSERFPEVDLPAIQWYRFARCHHQFTERLIGNCLHEYTCTLCGFVDVIDSGD
jgi:hypothetical protein